MNKNKKKDKTSIFAIITVSLLVIIIAIGFLVLPFFGIYGVYEVLNGFGLISVKFGNSFIGNLMYFAFVVLVMYFITLVLDVISKILIFKKKKKLAISRGSMILNYGIQAIIATFIFKMFLDNYFSRIDLSLIGSFFSFVILYMIYYAIVDDYEIEQ